MILFLTLLLFVSAVFAHHGVASLGYGGLYGPGSPLESSSSLTLPRGSFLFYTKLDHARFKTYRDKGPQQTELYQFWFFGLGYGLRSWLSLYLFVPYNYKKDTNNQFNIAGFADPILSAVFGFKYDEGFRLVPDDESLDELEDWHFTLYTSLSLPIAEDSPTDSLGNIDPVKSLGYGKPTLTLGFTATKMLSQSFTLVVNSSYMRFSENKYSNGLKYKFGDEIRGDLALVYSLFVNEKNKFRLDTTLEFNFLNIGRDEEFGKKLTASGGKILYSTLGVRFYYKQMSLGSGVKIPIWKELNEQNLQQGSEGLERYRAIFTLSFLF